MRHRRTRSTTEPRTEPAKGRPGRDRRPRFGGLTAFPKKLRAATVPAGGVGAAAVAVPGRSAAVVLASQVLRDGEAVLLVVRPSLWFVALSSLRWLIVAAALLFAGWGGAHSRSWVETAVAVAVGRLMVATAQWMGRLYVLTNLRVVTIAGALRAEVTDCALRKVARTRLVRSTADRGLGIGSVEIVPQDPAQPFAVWQQVARPAEVHEQIVAALNRAKQGCWGGD